MPGQVSARDDYDAAVHALTRPVADLVIAQAVIVGVLAAAIVPFLNPVVVAFQQERAEATAWTGFSTAELRIVTDAILSDLILGPPDFDVRLDGASILNDRERGHMRDVRMVFTGFFVLAAVLAGAALVVARRRRDAPADRARTWGAVRTGALVLVGTLIGLGALALVAFDVLFEVFHRALFAGGTYTFDPATERLVQLFPFRFWQETAIAVGVVATVLGLLVAFVAGRRRAGQTA